jgi:UTP--glucose-1-phosphate uridylyltransferase
VKVVIPAAGLGSRFLPATKSMPKEMLPVLDRPVIQYVVEEAVASGADDLIIVTGRSKRAIEDHFDFNPELGGLPEHSGLRELEELSERVTIHFVRQRQPRGLADSVLCAERHIGRETFGVLLGDTINVCRPPLLRQLFDRWEELGKEGSVIAVEPVPEEKISDYGIVDGSEVRPGVWKAQHFIEKPSREEAPGNLGITGAYVLSPGIFAAIRATPPGAHREVQLTDALARLAREEPVYAVSFSGKRYDIGDREIWLRTNIEFALRDAKLGPRLRSWLQEVGP